ncbi:MAG: hypothetical protein AB1721_02010 [Patescibacteria group bacterium]
MPISDFLEKFSSQEVIKKIAELDPALKDILDGEIGGSLMETILARYDFDFEYFSELMMLLALYLTRLISNQEFADELAQLVPEKYFFQFLQELEDKLWSPYDVYLNQAGIVYKQLVKLTPRPVETQQTTDDLQPTTGPETASAQQSAGQALKSEPVLAETELQAKQGTEALPKTEEIIITAPQAGQAEKIEPSAESPKPKVFQESARISFEALKNFVPRQTAEPPAEPVKTEPEIKSVKFEASKPAQDLSREIQAKTEEKPVEIPKPPTVPKTEVQGKEVIDLSDFGVSEPGKK